MWVLALTVFFGVILTGWIRRILHIVQLRLVSQFCVSLIPSVSWVIFCLGPAATGDETATEGEAHVRAFVFAPGTERHHNDSAVVFRSILKSLRETEKNQLTYYESYACLNLSESSWFSSKISFVFQRWTLDALQVWNDMKYIFERTNPLVVDVGLFDSLVQICAVRPL